MVPGPCAQSINSVGSTASPGGTPSRSDTSGSHTSGSSGELAISEASSSSLLESDVGSGIGSGSGFGVGVDITFGASRFSRTFFGVGSGLGFGVRLDITFDASRCCSGTFFDIL